VNFKALEPASGPLRAWTTIAMRAGLESPMVNILTGQAEVRPELALAILERKFPQRWAKVTVVAAPPHHLTFNVADILQKVQERIAQGQLPLPQSSMHP